MNILSKSVGIVFAVTSLSTPAYAGYLQPQDYTLLTNSWDLGTDTIKKSSTPGPGEATWSLMGAGISSAAGPGESKASERDPHTGHVTSNFTALLGQTELESFSYINNVLDLWAGHSGFTNLGRVDDSGGGLGTSNSNGGHVGDIRVGAIFIDGSVGSNVLGHAFSPCTNASCGHRHNASEDYHNGSIGGDLHIDDGNSWVDNPLANGSEIDLFTVLLHEFGHSLGLGHSTVAGSIMEATYTGARRTLHADDILGVQTLYGVPIVVPLPGSLILLISGLSVLGFFRPHK